MKDLKRISWLAIFLLVVLRVAIGWQMLYEGMWKYDQMDTPNPWSSEGYLKNAQGPFRDHFREMTGDPDDLNWLDYGKMSQKWYDWRDRFAKHYQLNNEQRILLDILLDSSADEDTAPNELPPFPTFSLKLDALPEGVDLGRYEGTIEYDSKAKQLKVMAPVLPSEEARIKGSVEADSRFYKVFDALVNYSRKPIEKQISDLSAKAKKKDSEVNAENLNFVNARWSSTVKRALPFRHRLAASLMGDPDRVGVYGELNEKGSFDLEMGTITRSEESKEKHNINFGKIKEYRKLLEEYEAALEQAKIDFQYDHVTMLGRKVAIMKADLVGPVKALQTELEETALKMLSAEQIGRGAMPPADTPLHRADMLAMWGLLILGTLLIFGLLTRFAAVMGAIMIFSFYLVLPPWPGVPPAPGPEHSFIVNKNLIEVIALLALATLPSGSWFGLDAYLSRFFFKGKQD